MLVQEGHDVTCVCRGTSPYAHESPELAEIREVHLTRGDADFEQEVARLGCDVVVDNICFTKAQAKSMVQALAGNVRHCVTAARYRRP